MLTVDGVEPKCRLVIYQYSFYPCKAISVSDITIQWQVLHVYLQSVMHFKSLVMTPIIINTLFVTGITFYEINTQEHEWGVTIYRKNRY